MVCKAPVRRSFRISDCSKQQMVCGRGEYLKITLCNYHIVTTYDISSNS